MGYSKADEIEENLGRKLNEEVEECDDDVVVPNERNDISSDDRVLEGMDTFNDKWA